MSSLMPPGDDEFDHAPAAPSRPSASGYDADFERAEQDRGSFGAVSVAYWIARGAQELFRLVRRT